METKSCQKCSNSFIIEETDKNFYAMVNVPLPTFCPTCRFQRRLTFRNDRTLYKRTCEMCKKDVISIYRPLSNSSGQADGNTKVVCQKCWWSDDWDPTKFGKEYDPSKPFLEQYKELMREIPFVANFIVDESRMVNSPYNNMALDLRNCYMMFDSDFDEDCLYGCEVETSRNCVDTNLVDKSEMCYECVNVQNCYRAFYSIDCESSSDIWFSRDCNGCTDCFGCVNLRKQSYCIFNEQMGNKANYMAKLEELGINSRKNIGELKKQAHEFWKKGIHKYMHEKQVQDVSGDYIYNSRNTHHSWIVHEGWNVKYCQYLVAPNTKDTYDITQFGNNIERFYEVVQGGNGGSNVRFSWFAVNENTEIDYCMQVMTSHDMLGCIGMRKKEFCILNNEYTEEEYNKLHAQIIAEMATNPYVDAKGLVYKYGEFFPSELSPFAYNETTAQEFFPLDESVAKAKGFDWYVREKRDYKPTMAAVDIPDTIADAPETITSEIIECVNKGDQKKNCTTAFKIIPDEFGFYQRFNLPLPDKCPNCRHAERMQLRNKPIFHTGKCTFEGTSTGSAQACGKEILTAYPEDTPNLYCKEHYLQTVV